MPRRAPAARPVASKRRRWDRRQATIAAMAILLVVLLVGSSLTALIYGNV